MWTIFKGFVEFVTIWLLFHFWGFFFLVARYLSSPTRDQNPTPCIGRPNLNHWTTREVPVWCFLTAGIVRVQTIGEYIS